MGEFSKEVNASFSSDAVKVMLNIRYTAQFLSGMLESGLKPYGITNAQYNILRILRGAKEPITMRIVKERMIEKSPNATRLADKLCDKNMIERVRCDKDRRAVYVSITEKGLDVLQEISFDNVYKYIENLDVNEQQLLSQLLDKIRD